MVRFSKLVIFLLLCSFPLHGQRLSTTLLTIEDGLSQSTVNDVLKGPYGYYWFATEAGLSRYDGYTFKNYNAHHFPQLKSSFFTRIVKLDQSHLLLGTVNGLYKINVLTEKLELIKKPQVSGAVISDIQLGANGVTVIAGDKVLHFDADFEISSRPINQALAKIGRGLFTYAGTQYYISAAGRVEPTFIDQEIATELTSFNRQIYSELLTFHAQQNELWLGTSEGLWKIEPSKVKKLLEGIEVKFIAKDQRQRIWLAGKNGIYSALVNDKETLALEEITTGLKEGAALSTYDLSSLYVGSEYVWFGMVSKGLAFYRPKEKWVENFSTKAGKITLPSNDVLSILTEPSIVWIATGDGLVYVQNDSAHLLNKTEQPSFYSNRVTKIEKDMAGRTWLGFDQGGLVYKGPATSNFRRLALKGDSVFVKDFLVIDDLLYVATKSSGLYAVKVNSGEVEHFHKNNTDGLLTNRIQSLQQGLNGSVLIGSFGKGIFLFDPETKIFTPATEVYPALAEPLKSAIIADMQIVGDELWATTSMGAFRYNLITKEVLHLSTKSGLPHDIVYTVIPDNGAYWLPTNKGIAYFESETNFITSYAKPEGFINNEYNANAFAKGVDGSLWVGGVSGVSVINPELRPKYEAHLIPKLTEVKLFNQEIRGEEKSKSVQIDFDSASLALASEIRMFSLYFSTFHVDLSKVVKFKYKLEGFDEKWVFNESGINFVTYTNIEYGEYKLLVSASLDNQNWSVPYEVEVVIAPPIWLTLKAKLLYLLVVSSILLLLAYLIWSKIKAEKEVFIKTKRSEQKLQFSMHTSGSILWEIDLVNSEFRMIDYQGKEKQCKIGALTKLGLTQVLHEQDAETLLEMLEGELNEDVFMERQYLRFLNNNEFTWMKGNSVISSRSGDGKAELITGVSYNVNELKRTQLALKELNQELESRVQERTEELNVSHGKLQTTLENLQLAQEELIESQKMAALGAMVTGISHEINTPLGICVTGLSHLDNLVDEIQDKLVNKSLTQADLVGFLHTCTESLRLLNKNVERAAELVKSFKQVSVEETDEQLSEFCLYKVVEDTLGLMKDEVTKNNIDIELTFDKTLTLNSYPSAISQVIRNLTQNTIAHGFSHRESGKINISVVDISAEDNEILLIFSDDGSGIEEESLTKVFDPFYTSKRSAGNTGLGLHITYNLVVQRLKGAITVNSLSDTGTEFYIRLPLNLRLDN